jgi:hypothetical protein
VDKLTVLRPALIMAACLIIMSCFLRQEDPPYNAEEDFEVEIKKRYNSEEQYIIITKYIGERKNVNIPPYIQDLPVNEIGTEAFMDKALASVIIPDTVKDIFAFAFAKNQLTRVTISDNVIVIRDYVFAQNKLAHITFPSRLFTISEGAFYNNKLTSVTIPNSVHAILKSAFAGNRLVSVTIPRAIPIHESAFEANNLRHIKIPNRTYINKKVFYNNNLTSVIIPDGADRISESSFARNKLTSVTIPDSVIFIDESAFASNQLTSITISDWVNINETAFDDIGFIKYYLVNGRKAGTYTVSKGLWNGKFAEEKIIVEPQINGTYQITSAYANIYGRLSMDEVATVYRGTKIIINNDKAVFGGMEYQLYDAPGVASGKYSIISYDYFKTMYGDIAYGSLNKNIILPDYDGMVKVKRMRYDKNSYTLYIAGNQLIVQIFLYEKGFETETEFIHLAKQKGDHFLYVAEKITE